MKIFRKLAKMLGLRSHKRQISLYARASSAPRRAPAVQNKPSPASQADALERLRKRIESRDKKPAEQKKQSNRHRAIRWGRQ